MSPEGVELAQAAPGRGAVSVQETRSRSTACAPRICCHPVPGEGSGGGVRSACSHAVGWTNRWYEGLAF